MRITGTQYHFKMKKGALIILILANVLIANCLEIIIDTAQGRVKGYTGVNEQVYEFYRIPYAIAPTGKDKFKAPLAPPKRIATFDAVDREVKCSQKSYVSEENCLIVNIFKPNNNETNNPVVVYVHGGTFSSGYGNQLKPITLAENGIVAVTFNYRLGPLGFLCLNTESVPGNAGLKDQLAALRWVRDNIANFGGDNKNVTLAGYSAGAASSELLMLSKAANGLFNKVLLESGSGNVFWALDNDPIKTAQDYGKLIGIPKVDNVNTLSEYYTNQTEEQLYSMFYFKGQPYFKPCVEVNSNIVERIISEEPTITLERNTYTKLPIMLGFTNADGLIYFDDTVHVIKDMNRNFTDFLPRDKTLRITSLDVPKVRQFYFKNEEIDLRMFPAFIRYMTDVFFRYPIVTSARHYARNNSQVYLYEFSYVDSLEAFGLRNIGAGHCAQTYHVLDNDVFLLQNPFNIDDLNMRAKITGLWINFIKYGNPYNSLWSPLNTTTLNYLSINTLLEPKTKADMPTVLYWDSFKGQESSNAASKHQVHLLLYIALLFSFFKML